MSISEIAYGFWTILLLASRLIPGVTTEDCNGNDEQLENTLAQATSVHYLDLCELRAISVDNGKEERACTAHLVTVEGRLLAITAATCFLPWNLKAVGLAFKKYSNAWLHLGTVELTCGVNMQRFTIRSSETNQAAFVLKDFSMKKDFVHPQNMAIVNFAKEDYEKITEKDSVEFTRLAGIAEKGPSASSTCRCYSSEKGKDGKAVPTEYRVKQCPATAKLDAKFKKHTCFEMAKSSENDGYKMAEKLVACGKDEYCGIAQTMPCFCEGSLKDLRTLHSLGFYYHSKTKEGALRFLSTPLAPNWDFIMTVARITPQLAATDKQMEAAKASLAKAYPECLKESRVEHRYIDNLLKFLCGQTRFQGDEIKGLTDTAAFRKALTDGQKEFGECLEKKANGLVPLDPRGTPLPVSPLNDVLAMIPELRQDNLCSADKEQSETASAFAERKAKIVEGFKHAASRMSKKFQCFGLAFRSNFFMPVNPVKAYVVGAKASLYFPYLTMQALANGECRGEQGSARTDVDALDEFFCKAWMFLLSAVGFPLGFSAMATTVIGDIVAGTVNGVAHGVVAALHAK